METRIKELREDKDLLQKEIYTFLGIKQSAYSDIEKGINMPTADKLILLAKFYDTSIDYILGLTDIKIPYPRKKSPQKK